MSLGTRALRRGQNRPGTKGKATVAAIFVDAQTRLRKPTNLKALTDAIDKRDWFSAREEGLGNLYSHHPAVAGRHFLRPGREVSRARCSRLRKQNRPGHFWNFLSMI
jgi:hypothetical protein